MGIHESVCLNAVDHRIKRLSVVRHYSKLECPVCNFARWYVHGPGYVLVVYCDGNERYLVTDPQANKLRFPDCMFAALGYDTESEYLFSPMFTSLTTKVLALHPSCRFCPKPSAKVYIASYKLAVLRGDDLSGMVPAGRVTGQSKLRILTAAEEERIIALLANLNNQRLAR